MQQIALPLLRGKQLEHNCHKHSGSHQGKRKPQTLLTPAFAHMHFLNFFLFCLPYSPQM